MKPKLIAGIVVTAILLLLAALAIPDFLPAQFTSSGEPIAFKIRILAQEDGTPVPGAEVQIKWSSGITDAEGYCDIVQRFPAGGTVGRSGECSFSGTLRVSAPGFAVWERDMRYLFGATCDYFNRGSQLTQVVHLVRPMIAAQTLRVLIDASKDGGLWWFPQGPPIFDPQQPHQGSAMAEALRQRGWEVAELPRGAVITADGFKGYDVVIRPPAFFPYNEAEAIAYQQTVASGTRLLLMGQGGSDRLAESFGLRFDTSSRMDSVQKWLPHPLTAAIGCCDLAWRPITEAPKEAVLLAWLDREEPGTTPVAGYFAHGQGEVIFLGLTLHLLAPDQPVTTNVFDYLARASSSVSQPQPAESAILAAAPSGLSAPSLLAPLDGATLPQPEDAAWRFDWDDVEGAQQYQINVLGASATIPLLDATTRVSEVTIPDGQGYMADHNQSGWTWRVRAQDQKGKWGSWSEVRVFNVRARSPLRTQAEAGDVQSQNELGHAFQLGLHGLTTNHPAAVKWYRQATEQNSAAAQYNLGSCYRDGLGVAKFELEAYKWFLLAAAQGDKLGKRNAVVLELLLSPEQVQEGKRMADDWLEQRKSRKDPP